MSQGSEDDVGAHAARNRDLVALIGRHAIHLLCVAVLASSVSACDPGWSYQHVGPQPPSPGAGRYSISNARAHLFTSTLTIELSIRNTAKEELRIDPRSMRVSTASGQRLVTRFREPACSRLPSGEVAVLEQDGVCDLMGEFLVDPLRPPPFRNRDLRRLSVEMPLQGQSGTSRFEFEWL